MKLRAHLEEDLMQRRFSVISFDRDVAENVKIMQLICRDGLLVGMVFAHAPDFEFANFSCQELQGVASRPIGKNQLEDVRSADWSSVRSAKELETQFSRIAKVSLKARGWGAALAKMAKEFPRRPDDTKQLRPIWEQINIARAAWKWDYDLEKKEFMLDPLTLERVSRPNPL